MGQKFYVVLDDDRDFVCHADSPDSAIEKFWKHQAAKLNEIPLEVWPVLDVGRFAIEPQYHVHTGRIFESVEHSSAAAYLRMSHFESCLICHAIADRYGAEQLDKFMDEVGHEIERMYP